MRKIGLLLGAILGAIGGLLFAPRSGKEFRKRLKDDIKKGGVGIDPLKEDAKIIGKDIKDTYNEVKESDQVKKAVKKGKKKAKKLLKKGEEQMGKAVAKGRKKVDSLLKKGKGKLDKVTDKAFSYGLTESKKLKTKKKGKK